MRAVVQRTIGSSVVVDGQIVGQIGQGIMALIGIKQGDTKQDAEYLMDKIINLRIFEDNEGKMNASLLDVKGELLLVSQFTLYGDVRKGRRPSFSNAELPELAEPLFNYAVEYAQKYGINVQTGEFGAAMKVNIINDGPCTILLDSEKVF